MTSVFQYNWVNNSCSLSLLRTLSSLYYLAIAIAIAILLDIATDKIMQVTSIMVYSIMPVKLSLIVYSSRATTFTEKMTASHYTMGFMCEVQVFVKFEFT